jgi:hypothetical protein
MLHIIRYLGVFIACVVVAAFRVGFGLCHDTLYIRDLFKCLGTFSLPAGHDRWSSFTHINLVLLATDDVHLIQSRTPKFVNNAFSSSFSQSPTDDCDFWIRTSASLRGSVTTQHLNFTILQLRPWTDERPGGSFISQKTTSRKPLTNIPAI